MKKTILFILLLISIFALTSCNGNKEKTTATIDLSNISQVEIFHIIGGQENTITLDNQDEISKISEWLTTLQMELKTFDDSNSPGKLTRREGSHSFSRKVAHKS